MFEPLRRSRASVLPAGRPLGFVSLPAGFFAFLAAVTVTYLLLVEAVKRRVMWRLMV
jgi:P-type Mg2+ transporter